MSENISYVKNYILLLEMSFLLIRYIDNLSIVKELFCKLLLSHCKQYVVLEVTCKYI